MTVITITGSIAARYQVLKTQNLRAANMSPLKKPQYKRALKNLGVYSRSCNVVDKQSEV